MIASPQLWVVQSYQYTLEWPLSVVVRSWVLVVCHDTNKRGPFKKPSLMGGRWATKKGNDTLVDYFLESISKVTKRSFYSNKQEFEACILVGTLIGIWCSIDQGSSPILKHSSVNHSKLSSWECAHSSSLTDKEDWCLLRCASDWINRQLCWFMNVPSNS